MSTVRIRLSNWSSEWQNKGVWIYVDVSPYDREWKGTYYRCRAPEIEIPGLQPGTVIRYALHPPGGGFITQTCTVPEPILELECPRPDQVLNLHFWYEGGRSEVSTAALIEEWTRQTDEVNMLFEANDLGVRVNSIGFKEMKIGPPSIDEYRSLSMSTTSGYDYMGDRIGRVVNVYLSNRYLFMENGRVRERGVARESSKLIGLTEGARCNLLAHEIGHVLGLSDIQNLTGGIRKDNIMSSIGCMRQTLTHGQVALVHSRLDGTDGPLVEGRDLPCVALHPTGDVYTPDYVSCYNMDVIQQLVGEPSLAVDNIARHGDVAISSACWNAQFDFEHWLEHTTKLEMTQKAVIKNRLNIG